MSTADPGEDPRFLKLLDGVVTRHVAGKTYFYEARCELREGMIALGYKSFLDELCAAGSVPVEMTWVHQTISVNSSIRREFKEWKVGQDPDILDAFPAQELIRWHAGEINSVWIERWRVLGGKLWNGRMIARKNDPIWTALSDFGLPHPPFDFLGDMGVRDVSRDQAEALGVIGKGEKILPAQIGSF